MAKKGKKKKSEVAPEDFSAEEMMEALDKRVSDEGRTCKGCDHCDFDESDPESTACGWRSGLMLKEHSPTELGVVLEYRELNPMGLVVCLREVRDGAGQSADAVGIAQTFAGSGQLVLLGDKEGVVRHLMGPEDRVSKLRAAMGAASAGV